MSNADFRLCRYTAASAEVANPNSNVKLLSLLALSASAVALPQAGEGAIVYSGILNELVGTTHNASYQLALPGAVNLQLWHQSSGASVKLRQVYFGQQNAYARVRIDTNSLLLVADAGPKWTGLGGAVTSKGLAGAVWSTGNPLVAREFTDKYAGFIFQDSTAGNALRYGWAKMSLTLTGGNAEATLISWAYDDGGAEIAMGDVGAVPEPVSEAMAVMGALALGAAGVRRWRAHKKAACSRD